MCMVVVHTTMSVLLYAKTRLVRCPVFIFICYFSLQDSNSGSSFLGRNFDGVLFLVGVLRFVGDEC